MRELERLSGVRRDVLSLAESGRLNPTGEEFDRVMAALGVDSDEPAPTEDAQTAAS